MMRDVVMIPIETCGFTLDQMMTCINWMIKEFPDREIFLDGDTYSIMGRRRCAE